MVSIPHRQNNRQTERLLAGAKKGSEGSMIYFVVGVAAVALGTAIGTVAASGFVVGVVWVIIRMGKKHA